MVYRVDLTPDKQYILFWTGIGKKKEATKSGEQKLSQEDYTLKAKLDDGFSVIGTRIEVMEKEIRESYSRYQGKLRYLPSNTLELS